MIQHDLVIVGGGLAGMLAALQAKKHVDDVAIISKVHVLRSHTIAAQGGIGAALGNEEDDDWRLHMFDTVKGSDYLADQDAVEIMTKEAPETILDLEHMGVPFSRDANGRIAQRPFGGHQRSRACYAADRTGHVIMHTLFGENLRARTTIYNEYFVISLLLEDHVCNGLVAFDLRTGEPEVFHAKAVLLATGGYGQAYKVTSNGRANTGDGLSMVYRQGLPLEDMEFVQIHPTGLPGTGILITEGARGEGGYLLNGKGERFMQNYAPKMMEIAPRDIISQAMYIEMQEERGINGENFLHLDLRHLGREKILKKLPAVFEFCRDLIDLDPSEEPIPIAPTAHFSMGGIPVTIDGEVRADATGKLVAGLYAAGECACVSAHGANRLGTNALLEAAVFGRRVGRVAGEFAKEAAFARIRDDAARAADEEMKGIMERNGSERPITIRRELQEVMMEQVGVFRNQAGMKIAQQKVAELKERYKGVRLDDRKKPFNTELQEALELGRIIDFCEAIVESALAREESRGAHYRDDFTSRDDENWLAHTFVSRTPEEKIRLEKAPVTITEHEPAERKY